MLLSALQPLLCFSNGTAVEGVGGVVSKMPSDGLLRRVAEANSSGVRFAMSLAGGNGRLEAQARAEVHLQRRQGQRQTHTQWEDELRLQPEHQSQLQPNPNPERGRNLAVTQKTVAKERERREMVGGKKEELAADGNNDAGKEEPWEEASGEASGEQGAWEKTVGRGQGGDETLAATGAQSVPPSLAVTSPTCPWSVNLHDFSEMMTMSVVVTIGGTHRDAGTLAAVVKSSVRGTQDTPKSPLFGPYAGRGVFQITIHANEGGETVGFVFTDGSTRTILDETLTFVVDADQGSVVSPFALTAAAGGAPIQWDWTGSCRQIILTSLLSPEPPPLPALSVADILVQERVARLTASGGVNVILDTDMSIDVDDVGAVCVMHALADRGEVNILAVVHNTASDQGVGALSVLNRYYGRDDIPLGAYQGRIGLPNKNYQSPWGFTRVPPQAAWQVGPYVGDLVATFPSRIRNASQAYDATALLRLVLSAASGKSVTVVSVGYATNLLNLLESSSDSMSVLTGQALVSQKVKQLVMMGGRHQFHPGDPVEWNLAGATWQASVCGGACGESNNLGRITNRTLAMWPQETRLVFLDFETGVDVWVGDVLRFGAPHSSPCRRAYEVFCRINVGWCHLMSRCSWDIMALVFAVRGAESFYSAEAGHNEVDPLTGHNTWVAARPGTASNNEFSLMLPVELYGAVEKEINALLLQRPLLETTGLEVREGKEEEVALQRPLLETTGLEVREGKEEEVAGEDVADQAAVAAAEEEVNLVGEEIDTGGVDMETREAVDLITKAGLAAKSITKLPPRSVGMVVLSILTAAIMAAMCTCFALATLWVTMSGRLAHLRRELKVSSERRETEGARLVQEYESI